MKPVFYYVAALAALVLATGCSHRTGSNRAAASEPKGSARLNQAEVTRIAAEAAAKQGYRLAEYKSPQVRYELTHKDKIWTVFYDGKAPAPPGHDFLVVVDDQTGTAQVMHGE
jgi:hypothetical protein